MFACNRISADVWNDSLGIARAYHQEHGKWIDQTLLQKATKRNYSLHSQSIQAVCHKYLQARESAKRAKRKGFDHIRYPYKQKKHFSTKWAAQGFTLHENGKIHLSLGLHQGKRQKPIVVSIARMPVGTVKEIELIYDRGLQLVITYDDGVPAEPASGNQLAAVDPGEVHAITAVTEDGHAVIITGRKLRSIKRLRNLKMKELYRHLARCKKGSRQWKKYRRALQFVLSRSERQIRDALHKTTRAFVDWCLEHQVKEVAVGDVEGVQRNRSGRKRRKNGKRVRSRKHNQRMSQWTFGKQYAYLAYKLEAKGIQIRKQEEHGSTQTCPVCNRKHKPSGRIYRCRCGYSRHRDVHGSCGILSRRLYGDIRTVVPVITEQKYLRTA
ncbi:RNA-guided endonuclease InsQ/TnpB family protein [Paenibacillus vietnamensis]|uniref:RNA-guided endonuclease InsQ/TnpB family protein n=1 Tax=Paenibacillus vietnamensis TaxID=2590547 RepID=UPI001CD11BEE|nr:RNA-guided endonuclease TnpB family protein [Paenibacillus vietnamensis]